jgi:hypothetical protein
MSLVKHDQAGAHQQQVHPKVRAALLMEPTGHPPEVPFEGTYL